MSQSSSQEMISAFPMICLIIGIAIGYVTPDSIDCFVLPIAVLLVVVNVYLWVRPRYRFQALHRILIALNIIAFGSVSYHNNADYVTIEKGKSKAYGHIEKFVKDKESRLSVAFEADTLYVNDKMYNNVEGVAYFDKEKIKVVPGEYLQIYGNVESNMRDSTKFRFFVNRAVRDTSQHAVLPSIIYKLREWTESTLASAGYSRQNIGLLLALLMGDKSKLEYDIQKTFSECGIVHILAVSGMHVGIIYLFISYVVKMPFRRLPVLASGLTILLLWVYAIIAGLAPSIVRATLMMTIYEITRLRSGETIPLSALYMTLFIILVFSPESITSIGLWLSFSAVWGILLFYRHVSGIYRFKFPPFRYIYDSLSLSFVAQMSTLPFILYSFGSFPNLFLLSNLLAVPLIAPIIIGSIIALILTPISLTCAEMIASPIDDLLSFVCASAEWISSMEYSQATDISFTAIEGVLFLVFLYAFNKWLNNGGHRLVLISIGALTMLTFVSTYYFL